MPTHPHTIFLLMSTVDIPENYLSNVDQKPDMRKVPTSSVQSSSTLFYCSIRAMYNRVNCKKNASCYSHIFLDIDFSKETLRQYIFRKSSQLITCLYRKSPSCNTPPQCIRLNISQNQ